MTEKKHEGILWGWKLDGLELDGGYTTVQIHKNWVVHLRLVNLMYFITCTLYLKKKKSKVVNTYEQESCILDHVPGPNAAFYAIMVKGNQGINLHRLGYLGRMVRRKRKKKKKRKEEANYLSIILCLTILGGDLQICGRTWKN